MPDYRIFILGPDGHYSNMREFTALDRGEATKAALRYVDARYEDGRAVELWEGAVMIGTFKPSYRGGDPIFKRPRMARQSKK